jgi:hypothetical protein
MKLITTKYGYLLFAMIAFIFSAMGFAGLFRMQDQGANSVYFGALFLSAGVFFLVCFYKRR